MKKLISEFGSLLEYVEEKEKYYCDFGKHNQFKNDLKRLFEEIQTKDLETCIDLLKKMCDSNW